MTAFKKARIAGIRSPFVVYNPLDITGHMKDYKVAFGVQVDYDSFVFVHVVSSVELGAILESVPHIHAPFTSL
eukprot:CAMPEP_0177684900 /NCGR_PEP_ID=MMETSP0447-20121125/32681_1 /TAXON_ID=0 /ORGANISM="Stygamoeba regulata, Strain BSH-02190019" /LENGTH=72 /DNA_ID=CAMNT_0019194785 /DNA_START=60 /DNA_END=275 /DNA_ORIENTATION=-